MIALHEHTSLQRLGTHAARKAAVKHYQKSARRDARTQFAECGQRDCPSRNVTRVCVVSNKFTRLCAMARECDDHNVVGSACCELLKALPNGGGSGLSIREQHCLAAEGIAEKRVESNRIATGTNSPDRSRQRFEGRQ